MILVTGASGHVGANLVRELVQRGERVRVLARDDTRAIDGLDVEVVRGDLTSRQDLTRAVQGVRFVYNVAAFVSLRNIDRDKIFEVNVLGTRKLLEACLAAGVEKVVHCSSFGAVGRNPTGGPSDETFAVNPNHVELYYEQSKALSEHEVLKAVVAGLNVTMVNPSGIVGPWDFKPSSVGQTILDFCHRRLHAYVPGAFEFVAVRDVVAGHLLAMEKGRSGERYILSNQVHQLSEVLTWLEELTGIPKPRIAVSPRLIEHVAGVKDWFEHRFAPTRSPRFTQGVIRLLQSGKHADNRKAREELGWEPTPVRDAVAEQLEWFVEQGQVPAGVLKRAPRGGGARVAEVAAGAAKVS